MTKRHKKITFRDLAEATRFLAWYRNSNFGRYHSNVTVQNDTLNAEFARCSDWGVNERLAADAEARRIVLVDR